MSRHIQVSHGGGACVLIHTSWRNRERHGGNGRHHRSASPSNPVFGDTAAFPAAPAAGPKRPSALIGTRQPDKCDGAQQLERLVVPVPGVHRSTRLGDEGVDGLGRRRSGASGTGQQCRGSIPRSHTLLLAHAVPGIMCVAFVNHDNGFEAGRQLMEEYEPRSRGRQGTLLRSPLAAGARKA